MIKQKYAVMDNNGIIEDSNTLQALIEDENRIRKENKDIEGDLLFIEIHKRSG